ncbi:MAG: sulfite exporter TauE/SafE family protein [Maricaulaceae bacterium]|nr:sulfite exporter TauE/SafE family protein [Maricaulaceae bacterium]
MLADILSVLSGGLVGFVLGLIGGGGSILAVPLLVYVVGVREPHVAIGTGAVAVAASAALSLISHARAGTVKWRCALVFAAAGAAGALIGAELGKRTDGQVLLALFGVLMIAVGASMLRPRKAGENAEVQLTLQAAPRLLPPLVASGLLVGGLSGFFGIGGGFLIVPGLIAATAMPLLNAVGSSLVSVTSFGAATAGSYAAAGLVDWKIAALFIAGGAAGGVIGTLVSKKLAAKKRALAIVFAAIVITVGLFVAGQGGWTLLTR